MCCGCEVLTVSEALQPDYTTAQVVRFGGWVWVGREKSA